MKIDFEGRVVIVTGGTRGVGRGIAERYSSSGAQVIVCSRENPGEIGGIIFIQCDVREPDQIDRVISQVSDSFGRLDVLVNNAGGSPPADTATASPNFADKIVSLNLLAPLTFAQRVNTVMQAQPDGGVIVNISSVSGTRPSPGTAAYGAAKAGLINLTKTLAVEWAPKVRVNAVIAGMVKTEQADLHYGDAGAIAAIERSVPMQRLAAPVDVGNACLFLSSELASYVTGACLDVHGGGERPAYISARDAGY